MGETLLEPAWAYLCCKLLLQEPCQLSDEIMKFAPNYLEWKTKLSVLTKNKKILGYLMQICHFFGTLF